MAIKERNDSDLLALIGLIKSQKNIKLMKKYVDSVPSYSKVIKIPIGGHNQILINIPNTIKKLILRLVKDVLVPNYKYIKQRSKTKLMFGLVSGSLLIIYNTKTNHYSIGLTDLVTNILTTFDRKSEYVINEKLTKEFIRNICKITLSLN